MEMLPLDEAKRKLSEGDDPFDLDCLPNERNDALWEDIMRSYGLTLSELSALKNACFTSKYFHTFQCWTAIHRDRLFVYRDFCILFK